ncbi:MAG: ATP-binding protein, partial [Rhodopila sp.]
VLPQRQHRDHGWDLINRTFFLDDLPAVEDVSAFTGGQPLPLAYEQSVRAADGIADQRMLKAETVARIGAAKARLRETECRCAAAEALYQEAAASQQEARMAWAEACRTLPLGAEPAVKEVLAFLTERDKAIELNKSVELAEAEHADLVRTHAGWAARLAPLTASAEGGGAVSANPNMAADETDAPTLGTLLPLAEARLAAAQKDAEVRAALAAKREAAERALVQARAAQAQAETERAAWQADWDVALAALGRPAGEDPNVTDEVLDSLEALAQAQRDHAILSERVTGMQRDIERFAQHAASVAARVAPDLDPADPFALISALRVRLNEAREAANQRALLAEQAQTATDTAALARQALAARRDDLLGLLTQIGGGTIEEAEQRLQLAAERAAQAAAQTAARTRLAEDGDLLPPDTLRADVAAVAPDEVARLIQDAGNRRQDAQLAAQQAAALVAELTQRLNTAEGATEVVDAAADQQAAVARMGRVLEEALLNHVAAEMLDKALAVVEQQTEPEMLQRIARLFSALTDGVYERVLTEPDGERTRLILVQRGELPDKRQLVEDLSEGTRDQLYLALRLAAVQQHVTAAPPLPFIGDDILQTFDDDRALAALRVLQDISNKVQVILLTHHRHVLDLAAALPSGTVHVCRAAATLETA